MLKLARRARGHFVTLIEIRVHLIRVKPGHISSSVVYRGWEGKTGTLNLEPCSVVRPPPQSVSLLW